MPLYIKDPAVTNMTQRLATLRKTSKTEVLRQALIHELEREQGNPSLVEIGIAFARNLRKHANSDHAAPIDKAFIDSLYEGK